MTKNAMKEAAVAAENLLFDDWVDSIEDCVRSRSRGFIETMLEEGLDGVLSRPRYGRRKPSDRDREPPVVGAAAPAHKISDTPSTTDRSMILATRDCSEGLDENRPITEASSRQELRQQIPTRFATGPCGGDCYRPSTARRGVGGDHVAAARNRTHPGKTTAPCSY